MAQEKKTQDPEGLPPRRNRTEAVGRAASLWSGDLFDRAGFRDPTMVLRWPEIAGQDVAVLCQPLKLSESASGGVLTLKAEPGAAVFLQHESRSLCERINTYLGRQAVSRLRFVQGPVAARPKPRRREPGPATVRADDPALTYQGPEAVREALLKLARQRARDRLGD